MTNSPRQGTATLAVLIDADNAAPAIVEGLLAEVAKYGVAAVKRIYGDWTKPNLAGWKERLLSHSIQPIQQFRYTVGKNATDSAMIIDAMDLLYTGRFDGFCIVSSDSDFTRLASRIREQGLTVYGFGERKTPKPFVTACDKFIYSDVLRTEVDVEAEGGEGEGEGQNAPATRRRSSGELRQDSRLVRLLQSASQAVSDEDGWSTLGGMGNHIAKQAPEFDSRNYGYGKLSELVAATGLFEVETRNGGNNKTIWVRLKKRGRGGEGGDGRGAPVAGQASQVQLQLQPQPQQPAQQPAHASQSQQPQSSQSQSQPQSQQPQSQHQSPSQPQSQPQPQRPRHGQQQEGRRPAPMPSPTVAQPVPPVETPAPVVEFDAIPDPAPVRPAREDDEDAAGSASTLIPETIDTPEEAPKSRGRRATKRPDVTLSETPWPIDKSVFAAPGAMVLSAQVDAGEPSAPVAAKAAPAASANAVPEVPVEAEAKAEAPAKRPAAKKRAAAPRKRAVKKAAE